MEGFTLLVVCIAFLAETAGEGVDVVDVAAQTVDVYV